MNRSRFWFLAMLGIATLVTGSASAQTPTLTPGIDVSYWQDRIDWTAVRAHGARFAFVRVSDGLRTPDPRFDRHWRDARTHGLVRGAYQLFRPRQDAAAQADLLVDRAPRQAGDLPPALDVEYRDGVSSRVIVTRIREWIARYRHRTGGRVVIIYTRDEFWQRLGSPRMPGTILWVARYRSAPPTIPPTWSRWLFWQHTKRGRIPGVLDARGRSAPVDLNHFSGDVRDLRALARID